MSEIEESFLRWWQMLAPELPEPEREYRFSPPRRWRFDFAWLPQKIAVECDGGTWVRGRHTRGSGYRKDAEKRNAATAQGWRVFHVTTGMLRDDPAGFVAMIAGVLNERQ